MTSAIDNIPFKAIWTQENRYLKTACLEKIHRIFFSFLHNFCSKVIVPAATAFPKSEVLKLEENFYNSHKDQFKIKRLSITTADGVKIRATMLQHKKGQDTSPLVLCCQPNLATSYSSVFDPLIQKAVYDGKIANYLLFDYRGCGLSEGKIVAAKDMIIDADSVYQFAKDYLQVPENQIHISGCSLGGGVACALKKIHRSSGGKLFIDRSFTSIADTACAMLGGKTFGKCIKYLLNFLGWDHLNTKKNLQSIQSPVLITYHENDEVIQPSAQLSHQNLSLSTDQVQIQSLNNSLVEECVARTHRERRQNIPSANIHCHPLSFFKISDALHGDDLACNFLLSDTENDYEALYNAGKKFIESVPQNERDMFYRHIASKYLPVDTSDPATQGAELLFNNQDILKKELKEFMTKRFVLTSANTNP